MPLGHLHKIHPPTILAVFGRVKAVLVLKQNHLTIMPFLRPHNDILCHIAPRPRIVLVDYEVHRNTVRPVALVYRRNTYVPDLGGKMLQRICQVPVELELKQENLLAMYRGKLAEQFVAQELLAKNGSELFYWARDVRSSSAEVDYLTVRKGNIYPVEIKSGAAGSLKSLHLMLEKYQNCPQGLVLYSGTYKELPEQKLTFMPLYCAATISDYTHRV